MELAQVWMKTYNMYNGASWLDYLPRPQFRLAPNCSINLYVLKSTSEIIFSTPIFFLYPWKTRHSQNATTCVPANEISRNWCCWRAPIISLSPSPSSSSGPLPTRSFIFRPSSGAHRGLSRRQQDVHHAEVSSLVCHQVQPARLYILTFFLVDLPSRPKSIPILSVRNQCMSYEEELDHNFEFFLLLS